MSTATPAAPQPKPTRPNLLTFDARAAFNNGRWLKIDWPGVPDFDFEVHILSRQSDSFLAAMRANAEEAKKAGIVPENTPEADERNNFDMTVALTQGWRGADAPEYTADNVRTVYTLQRHILRQVQAAAMDDAGFLVPPSSSSPPTPAANSSSTSPEKTEPPTAST